MPPHLLYLLAALLLAQASPTPGASSPPTNLTFPLHINGNCTWSGTPPACHPTCPPAFPSLVFTTNYTANPFSDPFGSGPPCQSGEKSLCCTPSAPSHSCHVEVHNSTCLNLVFPLTSASSSTLEPDAPSFLGLLNSTLPNCTNLQDTLLMREVDVQGLYAFNNGHTSQGWMTCASWGVENLCCGRG